MNLENGLERAKRERSLSKLSLLSGVGYSYVSKLAGGHSALDKVSPAYRKALEDGLRKLFGEDGEPHAG